MIWVVSCLLHTSSRTVIENNVGCFFFLLDEESQNLQEAWRKQAQKELDDWYNREADQLTKSKASNRWDDMMKFITEWIITRRASKLNIQVWGPLPPPPPSTQIKGPNWFSEIVCFCQVSALRSQLSKLSNPFHQWATNVLRSDFPLLRAVIF